MRSTSIILALARGWAATASPRDLLAGQPIRIGEFQVERETLSQILRWKAIKDNVRNLHTHVYVCLDTYTHMMPRAHINTH